MVVDKNNAHRHQKSVNHGSIILGALEIFLFECVYSVSLFTDQLISKDEDEGGGEEKSQASVQQTSHAHAYFYCQAGGFQRRGWVTVFNSLKAFSLQFNSVNTVSRPLLI